MFRFAAVCALCVLPFLTLLAEERLPLLKADRVWPQLQLDFPVDLQFSPAQFGLAYVLEQKRATIQAFNVEGPLNQRVALDLSDIVSARRNEMGLLSMALDPQFADNGYIYVYYTTSKPRKGILARYQAVADDKSSFDPESALVLLEVDQPWGNHNGAGLLFGPDGMLFLGLGDGGSAGDPQNHGQSLGTLLGAVLRLDVSASTSSQPYTIPPDNPFIGKNGARDEIWAYGLRNPWRMAFDRETGQLWAADVGQNAREEVNIITKGGNFGWNIMEGTKAFRGRAQSDLIDPIFEYNHSNEGGRSITGGFVYRGTDITGLVGAYLCADYVSGRVWAVRPQGDGSESRVVLNNMKLTSSFGQAPDGRLFIVNHRGSLLQINKH